MNTIIDVKKKYNTQEVYKWEFYHYSAPVYWVEKSGKIIIVDLRREGYPEWFKADALRKITKDRFHAIIGDKYIVGDARKGIIIHTFKIPSWPKLSIWKTRLSENKESAPEAEKFFMDIVVQWMDSRARGIKKATRYKSIEEIAKFTIKEVFRRHSV